MVQALLQQLCESAGADYDEVEDFIGQQLKAARQDAAARAARLIERKADGLFSYAALLNGHLQAEEAAGRGLDMARLACLPRGAAELFKAQFQRAFPKGVFEPLWTKAVRLLEAAAAAPDPLLAEVASQVLAADAGPGTNAGANAAFNRADAAATQELAGAVGLALRDGRYRFVHKSLVEWLVGHDGSSGVPTAGEFAVDTANGMVHLAEVHGLEHPIAARVSKERSPQPGLPQSTKRNPEPSHCESPPNVFPEIADSPPFPARQDSYCRSRTTSLHEVPAQTEPLHSSYPSHDPSEDWDSPSYWVHGGV